MDIDNIRNIGEKRKEILEREGYFTIEDVAFADPEDIQRALGISKEQAETIVDNAYHLYSEYKFWQEEIEECRNCGDVVIIEDVDEIPETPMWGTEIQREQYNEAMHSVQKMLSRIEYDFYKGEIKSTKELTLLIENVVGPLFSFYSSLDSGHRDEIHYLKINGVMEDSELMQDIRNSIRSDDEFPTYLAILEEILGESNDIQYMLNKCCELYAKINIVQEGDEDIPHLISLLDDFIDFEGLLKYYTLELGKRNPYGNSYKTVGELSEASVEELKLMGIPEIIAEEMIYTSKKMISKSSGLCLLQRMIDINDLSDYLSTLRNMGIRRVRDLQKTTPQILISCGISYEIAEDIITTANLYHKNESASNVLNEFSVNFEDFVLSTKSLNNITIEEIKRSTPKRIAKKYGFEIKFAEHFIKAANNYGKKDPVIEVARTMVEEGVLPRRYATLLYENGIKSIDDVIKIEIGSGKTVPITQIGGPYKLASMGLDLTVAKELYNNVLTFIEKAI